MKAVIGVVVVIIIFVGGTIFFFGDKSTTSENSVSQTEGQETQQSTSENRDVIPNITVKDTEGNPVDIKELVSGKPSVINSWTTWCPFCVDELPDFAELQEKYGDKVIVVAVNRRESVSKTQSYLVDLSVSNSMTYLYDSSDKWYRAIGGFSMPETLFVDADGGIVLHKRGPLKFSEMDSIVQEQLLISQ